MEKRGRGVKAVESGGFTPVGEEYMKTSDMKRSCVGLMRVVVKYWESVEW